MAASKLFLQTFQFVFLGTFVVGIGLAVFQFLLFIMPGPVHLTDPEMVMYIKPANYKQTVPNRTDEVTVVTAYFDIGDIMKVGKGLRTTETYFHWADIFGRLDNPLVVFTDSTKFYNHMIQLRAAFSDNRSRIFLVSRSELQAFSSAKKIKRLISKEGIPSIPPITTNENYTCITHAKFELMKRVLSQQYFNTTYYSWADIGVYRSFVSDNRTFYIKAPENLDPDKVMFGQILNKTPYPLNNILANARFWVAGGLFIAKRAPMLILIEDYNKTVQYLLAQDKTGTEEQILYLMYLNYLPFRPRVELQLYDGRNDPIHVWWAFAAHVRKLSFHMEQR